LDLFGENEIISKKKTQNSVYCESSVGELLLIKVPFFLFYILADPKIKITLIKLAAVK
jgi:hypothetical protein